MTWLKRLEGWARGVRAPRALVIGAGVTGLTSAIFLDDAGFRTTILERETARRRLLTSTVLTPSVLEGYDSVGLMGEILGASNPFAREVLNISDDRARLDPRLRAPAESRILPHAELLDILDRDAASRCIPVLRGRRVISVHQSPSHAYAVLADGRRATATYLVAADGGGSVPHAGIAVSSGSQHVRGWALSGVSPTRWSRESP
jgi:FAD-dependent urate hydroxylase